MSCSREKLGFYKCLKCLSEIGEKLESLYANIMQVYSFENISVKIIWDLTEFYFERLLLMVTTMCVALDKKYARTLLVSKFWIVARLFSSFQWQLFS